ncbi:hypothetical protein AB1N83_013841 [Pleurotus pulmonarius]
MCMGVAMGDEVQICGPYGVEGVGRKEYGWLRRGLEAPGVSWRKRGRHVESTEVIPIRFSEEKTKKHDPPLPKHPQTRINISACPMDLDLRRGSEMILDERRKMKVHKGAMEISRPFPIPPQTMSALTVSLAAYDAQHPPSPPPVLPVLPIHEEDDTDSSPGPSPPPSSSPSSSQLSTLTSSSSADSASLLTTSTGSMNIRANEHLAVLLPRHLWKEDALAAVCDNFYCRVRFSIFERRHHCRKCGSIFCGACTAHTTALLDTSSPALPFTHPPHRTPIALYASKDSPVLDNARVCTACFAQIHGIPQRERTPELVASRATHNNNTNTNNNKSKSVKAKPSISSLTSTTSASSSGSSSGSSSDAPRTPSSPSSPSSLASPTLPAAPHTRTRTRSRRRISLLTSTQPTLPADVLAALSSLSSLSHHSHHTMHAIHNSANNNTNAARAVSPIHAPDDPLAVYPLTRHSAVCKAMGGGRWTPSPSSPHSPLHSPLHTSPYNTSPLYTSPLHSPLLHNTSPYHCNTHTNMNTWNEKGTAEKKGYFDLGEIVSDEAGFRYRRAPHVHIQREHGEEEGEGEGVRPF